MDRGQQEAPTITKLPEYDPKASRFKLQKKSISDPLQCYLCPRNSRAVGDANPDYKNTFVFVNDYSAVKEDQAEYTPEEGSDGKLLSVSSVDIMMIDDTRPRRIPPQG